MNYRLLLVDGQGAATTSQLHIRTLREFPGAGGLSVHFRPVRSDILFESAKTGGGLAFRILSGEGIVRGQLWVEFQVRGEHLNVIGRSGDLLFALALITAMWKQPGEERTIAATGVLDAEGAVQPVERTVEKVAAAVRDLQSSQHPIIFFPAADIAAVESWRAGNAVAAHVEFRPVAHLEEALDQLGYVLEKVYLRNPFRGLEHFDYEHHSIFFGRDREVREVLGQLLRREDAGVPGVLIEGASGSGKSSFLRAGVLPALVHPRSQPDAARAAIERRPLSSVSGRAVWRPGLMATAADELAMVQSVCDCWRVFPEMQPGLTDGVRTFAELARKRREHWPATMRFVWVIDQFEEIFSLEPSRIAALGSFLAELQSDGVWTLAAVRADAMPQVKGIDTLRAVFGANEGQYYLDALRGVALDDVIGLPARAADLKFETGADGKSLDALLREDAYLEEGILPQLQFTLNELYLRRSGNELTFPAYRQLGGLSGSVAKVAESVLTSDDPETLRVVPRVFRSLVSVDEAGRASRRYAALAEIGQDKTQKRVVQRLVDARLCVADERDGQAVVAFAHDSLLRSLPILTSWLKEEAGLLQSRELAQREARLWQQHGEVDSWLASPDKLVLFKALGAAEVPLPPPVPEFMRRSQRRVRRAKLVRQTAVGAIAVLAVAASTAAWIAVKKQREAEYQTAQTLEAQSRSLTETAAIRLKEGDVGGAQGIIFDVLARRSSIVDASPALDVFQRSRAVDSQLLAIAAPGRVRRAIFSPDGKQIVAAVFDGTVRVWDVATGSQVQVLRGHTATVFSAAFSRDGKKIVSTAQDFTARVWDVASGRQLLLLSGHTNRATWGQFSPDDKRILTASKDGTVRIWDAGTGQQLQVLNAAVGTVSAAVFSPDGKSIAATGGDGIARIWDVAAARQIQLLKGHTGLISGIGFSPDGKRIVTAADDNARIWEVATGRQLLILSGHTDRLFFAEFSPDGTLVSTSASDNTARIWDATTGQQQLLYRGHSDWVPSASFSPDGSRIVSASFNGSIRVWDIDPAAAGQAMALFDPAYIVNSPSYSLDGNRIVTSLYDKSVVVWDAATAQPLLRFKGHTAALTGSVFSPDGKRILTSAEDNTARVWDAATGAELVKLVGHTQRVPGADYSPDGTRILTTADDKTARIWDAASGRQLLVLSGHGAAVNSGVYSPDGRLVATISVDKSVRLWDANTGQPLRVLNGHTASVYCVGFSPDGRRLVTGGHDNTARIWDVATGQQLRVLTGHTANVTSVGYSRDGMGIFTTGDQTVRIWDAATGQLQLVTQYSNPLHGAAWSPDGQRIASVMGAQYARISDARAEPIDVQVAYATAAQIEPLTREEKFHLGLVDSLDQPAAHSGKCTTSALPPVELQEAPLDRPEPAVPYASPAACENDGNAKARLAYQHGREMVETRDFVQAHRDFEAAVAGGYGPAQLDLAMLLSHPAAEMMDVPRAHALYESAWKEGLALAAFELGQLHEHGGKDEVQAMTWYRRAADANEPHALALLGKRATDAAYAEAVGPRKLELMLESFRYYAAAAEVAQLEEWPDHAWRDWRFHRASLARLLARQGMMRQVADAFGSVRGQYAPQDAR